MPYGRSNKEIAETHMRKSSGFKMAGWSAFTKADMPEADMPEVKVTPKMQDDRERYKILDAKLKKQTYLEDAEAREYDALAKAMDKK